MEDAQKQVVWAEFMRRYDIALFRLTRDHYWARRTLRNLQPVAKTKGTLSVDPWLRLYVNAEYILGAWDQQQLEGGIWHEVHHILRDHPGRMGDGTSFKNHRHANMAADVEINGDLQRSGTVLPPDVLTPENQGLPDRTPAEALYTLLQEQAAQAPGPDPGDMGGEAPPQDDGGEPAPPGGSGSKQEGDSGDQPSEQGKGKSKDAKQDNQAGDGSGGDAGDEQSDQEGGDQEQDSDETQDGPDWDGCGLGASGEADPEALPEPDEEQQARMDREERRQAEEIVQHVASKGHADTTEAVYKAAKLRIGTSVVDWRQEIGPLIRAAYEQVSDEAEEYTFKRRSRRQSSFEDVLLPGSYRPVPNLYVLADVSGSMDFGKLEQVLTEVHGILDRLAIPTFMAVPYCTLPMSEFPIPVANKQDMQRVMADVGGGTDMLSGIEYCFEQGADLVVVLSDLDCRWKPWSFDKPVIIGGIRADGREHGLPKGVPYVAIKEVKPDAA